ncbi:MAG: diaminopimelate dehydrogenase [Veillonellaceae bacterium]|nr:diaminopimelate dehydrogenase [Veillonellaceae bacterium]
MIRVGIFGYGNLGRGTELAIRKNDDMELVAVFTRRDPSKVKIQTAGVPVVSSDDVASWKDRIDVMVICGGSATDLPVQTPKLTELFNTVDSFDTHARIPEHFAAVDDAGNRNGHVSIISVGWDPGLFSLARVYGDAILPGSKPFTFWGRGVSQGHSDAIRRVKGVRDARQYTVPVQSALDAVRNGESPDFTPRQMHTRECYVVLEDGADKEQVAHDIKTMPNYFDEYDTTIHFITEEELQKNHSGLPHGGFVIRAGYTGKNDEHRHIIEYSLQLDSNPEFTTSVLVAYARAAVRLHSEGVSGAKSVLDIPPAYLSSKSDAELRKNLL